MKYFKVGKDQKYPERATKQSVGYDVTAIATPERRGYCLWYDTGVKINELPKGSFLMLVARSSIYKMGIRLANSVGIIDPDYEDTIKVVFDFDREEAFGDLKIYQAGERIAQLVVMNYHTEEEAFAPKMIRAGGFGSTDKPKKVAKKKKTKQR